MKKNLLFAAVFAAVLPVIAAAAPADRFPLFDINMGLKNSAMAGAFTGLADDASAVYVNPAGLTALRQIEISGAFDKWMLDSFEFLNVGIPAGPATVCGSVVYSDLGKFIGRDGFGQLNGMDVTGFKIGGALGFGIPVTDFLSAGLTLKLLNMSLGDVTSVGVLFDAGVMAKFGMLSIGLAGSNMEIAPDAFASYGVRCGAAAALLDSDTMKLTVAADIKYSKLYPLSYALGAECVLFKTLALRAGYRIEPENGLTGGASGLTAGLGIILSKLSFEYSLEDRGDLGFMHMAGIKLLYESDEEKDKKNYEKLQQFMAYQYFREGRDFYETGDFKNALSKYEQAKALNPEYEGIDILISKARKLVSGVYDLKKADASFAAGMKFYENGDFEKAVSKWELVKKYNPEYKDIDTWLQDANDLAGAKGMSKNTEKYFREGMKYFNNCEYGPAIDKWQAGLEKEPANKKLIQYIERTKAKQLQIAEGIKAAKADVEKDASVVSGIKKLREIEGICPAYRDAEDILVTLKTMIEEKSRQYYFKGIEKYTEGNLDAAIVYWKSIEDMDPKNEYVKKVRRYIEDARSKQKAIDTMEKAKKK